MNILFRNFLLKNLVVTLLLAIVGGLIYFGIFPSFYHRFFPGILLIVLSVNLLLFYISTRKTMAEVQLLSLVSKVFAVKFSSYLLIALVFLLIEKTKSLRISFVITLFVLYFTYTWLEITSLLKYLKSEKNT